MSSIYVVLGLVASLDLEVKQTNMKTIILHGDLEEDIYLEQVEGFLRKAKEDYMCKLRKSPYGLKQIPRQWYKKFESVMWKQGCKKITLCFSRDSLMVIFIIVLL